MALQANFHKSVSSNYLNSPSLRVIALRKMKKILIMGFIYLQFIQTNPHINVLCIQEGELSEALLNIRYISVGLSTTSYLLVYKCYLHNKIFLF